MKLCIVYSKSRFKIPQGNKSAVMKCDAKYERFLNRFEYDPLKGMHACRSTLCARLSTFLLQVAIVFDFDLVRMSLVRGEITVIKGLRCRTNEDLMRPFQRQRTIATCIVKD